MLISSRKEAKRYRREARKEMKSLCERRRRSGAYGAVYSPAREGAVLPFLQGLLIEKVIELVTCVRNTKQRAEETNELVICPGKSIWPFQATEHSASGPLNKIVARHVERESEQMHRRERMVN